MAPERISKTDTRSQRTAYRWGAVAMGSPFVAIGTYFAGAGFGAWALPSKANAPLAVIGCVGLAFALIGLWLVVAGVRGVIAQRRGYEPWTEDGVTDRAASRTFGVLWGVVFLAVFLMPFNWWAFFSNDKSLMVQIITSVFDLVLVAMVGCFFYRLLQFLKYGFSRLRFHGAPFETGGRVEVTFSPNRFGEIKATLRFVEEKFVTTGCGDNRRTQLVVSQHYCEERTLNPRRTDAEVDIEFDLPDDPGLVTDLTGRPVRYWELLVEAETPGVDFRTTFPLPVKEKA